MGKRVVVIGATGFVGGHILAALSSYTNWSVAAVSRTITAEDVAGFENTMAVPCEMANLCDVVAATAHADVVICCYRESPGQNAKLVVTNLIEATRVNGVSRLIYMSSVAVYGEVSGLVAEDAAQAPTSDWYALAKREAEDLLRAGSTTGTMSIVVLRPSLIYGPGGREWSIDFVESIARGHLLGLGRAADGTANLLYVEDLAAFSVKLMTAELPRFLVLNVNGPRRSIFNEYFGEIRAAILELANREPPYVRMPFGGKARRILRGLLKVLDRLPRRHGAGFDTFGQKLAHMKFALRPRPHDFPASFYSTTAYYSSERAQAYGLTGQRTMQQGTRAVVAWMRSAGFL